MTGGRSAITLEVLGGILYIGPLEGEGVSPLPSLPALLPQAVGPVGEGEVEPAPYAHGTDEPVTIDELIEVVPFGLEDVLDDIEPPVVGPVHIQKGLADFIVPLDNRVGAAPSLLQGEVRCVFGLGEGAFRGGHGLGSFWFSVCFIASATIQVGIWLEPLSRNFLFLSGPTPLDRVSICTYTGGVGRVLACYRSRPQYKG